MENQPNQQHESNDEMYEVMEYYEMDEETIREMIQNGEEIYFMDEHEYQHFINSQEKVFLLHCKKCNVQLTCRAAQVLLCSDSNVSLYSTDFITKQVQEMKNEYTISTCKCKIRDVVCASCQAKIGYHVTNACKDCLESPNNGHYWMFHENSVHASIRKDDKGNELTWATIPGRDDHVRVFKNEVPSLMYCPICYELLDDPQILKCGHTFCKICIVRQIDLHKKCPICRQDALIDELYPNLLVKELIDNLEVYCKYGCKKEGEEWVVNEEGCPEIIKLGERAIHEKVCKFAQQEQKENLSKLSLL